jgi:hypothetical protein
LKTVTGSTPESLAAEPVTLPVSPAAGTPDWAAASCGANTTGKITRRQKQVPSQTGALNESNAYAARQQPAFCRSVGKRQNFGVSIHRLIELIGRLRMI